MLFKRKKAKKLKRIRSVVPINTAMKICEHKRSYFFPGGDKVVLYNLIEIVVRPSGSHRIKTANGKHHIIAAGWLHIEIDTNGTWVF